MIHFTKYKLKNGLTVILHNDQSTPLVAVNVLYKVGSKNESPDKTGFAHLFEHLMFGGSQNVPDFDTPIQVAGGDNNAFTNSDLTNFYDIMPAENLETALWLESDRMKSLIFSQESLDIQKKVVIEEFKETSINKPYGDLWHELSALVYTQHPYRWPTIGLVPQHIEDANLDDVKLFFKNHYKPSNAILVVAGKIDEGNIKSKIEQWFGSIEGDSNLPPAIPEEPAQIEYRQKTIYRPVPSNAIYLAFRMSERLHSDFAVCDVISEVLCGGRSSRFYQNLIKNANYFSNVDAYISGSMDPGLFIIEGKLLDDADIDQARELIWKELEDLTNSLVEKEELQKVKNGLLSSIAFSEVSIINKAINLAYFEMLKDADMINNQEEEYINIVPEDLQRVSKELFKKTNCCEILYLKE
ncbi:MAG: insulinase family protein [Saprospiraceae bacterium]|nr:insulinase family protein [Bacteroidia bacterium]NNE14856.1 insulinase family protein [Saprospiraceae bacterium]NNL91898.1 insulinase family protein [Saprospiraceae bacterium]